MKLKGGEMKKAGSFELDMTIKKVVTKGKGPIPRYQHAAAVFKDHFIVHGGKNDQMYGQNLKEVALNDIHMLDLTTNCWSTLAIFTSDFPTSRFGHSMVATRNQLFILGGMSISGYNEANIYEVQLGKKL
jgi:hypothetical protein